MMRNFIILLFPMILGCSSQPEPGTKDSIFAEQYRPQYHFTPPSQWMNDPNGMLYYEGEYHLFYQHYPDSNVWGPMHWGHAVSKDLVHWEHLPIALYPDELGYIFSGSAVVDWNNISGLGREEEPPIVAIFTYSNPEWEKSGRDDFQFQGMAYSNDKGRTWTKYKENPILPNPGIRDFRDPKVIWYEPGKKWIMSLAIWDHVSFYSSKDLIEWKKESDFGLNWGSHAGVWECPDLLPMTIVETGETKWVLLVSINPGGPQGGSATQYFIGEFDGKTFSLNSDFSSELGSIPEYDPEGVIFEDFESGYQKWNVTGDAFGDGPVSGPFENQGDVEGFTGERFASSYHGGETPTGKMESETFIIDHPFINFRFGGGNDLIKTYIALVVDGEEVRKSAGKNKELLTLHSWDVSDLKGKEAYILIVDELIMGWGHVNVDDIKFSNEQAKPLYEKAVWLDYGADNYAGVTWSDVPKEDGRTLFIGWMSNWQYANVVPTVEWRSAMTLPRELTLHFKDGKYRIFSKPVEETNSILNSSAESPNELSPSLINVDVDGDFSIRLFNNKSEEIEIKKSGNDFSVDRTKSGLTNFSSVFGAVHQMDTRGVEIRNLKLYLDASSIEIFINDGELVMTELVFPSEPYHELQSDGDITSLDIIPIKTIWE